MDLLTLDELQKIWRPFKDDNERERAKILIPLVSDSLREEAIKVGKDIDEMIAKRSSFSGVVKSVVADVTARTLMTATDAEPMVQTTESALGYSVSGTYLVPGGGLFIKKSELARLGLRRQRMGVLELYGSD